MRFLLTPLAKSITWARVVVPVFTSSMVSVTAVSSILIRFSTAPLGLLPTCVSTTRDAAAGSWLTAPPSVTISPSAVGDQKLHDPFAKKPLESITSTLSAWPAMMSLVGLRGPAPSGSNGNRQYFLRLPSQRRWSSELNTAKYRSSREDVRLKLLTPIEAVANVELTLVMFEVISVSALFRPATLFAVNCLPPPSVATSVRKSKVHFGGVLVSQSFLPKPMV